MGEKESKIFISLGSNEGDRVGILEKACELIEQEVGPILKRSSTYETGPWGMERAKPFLNLVIQVTSLHSPHKLLAILLEIERKMGRIRDTGSRIYLPRSIDIDILFYGSEIVDSPELTIPHVYIPERRFVLVPLAEIAAGFIHPTLGISIGRLLQECGDTGVVSVFG